MGKVNHKKKQKQHAKKQNKHSNRTFDEFVFKCSSVAVFEETDLINLLISIPWNLDFHHSNILFTVIICSLSYRVRSRQTTERFKRRI